MLWVCVRKNYKAKYSPNLNSCGVEGSLPLSCARRRRAIFHAWVCAEGPWNLSEPTRRGPPGWNLEPWNLEVAWNLPEPPAGRELEPGT